MSAMEQEAVAAEALHGQVAVVTGAAGGAGAAVTAALAAAGAAVVGVDRDAGAVAAAPRVHPHAADVTRDEEVEALVAATVARHGRLDVVVNTVGMSGRRLGDGPVDRCPPEAWDAVLDTNLRSTYLVSRHAIPALRAAGGGAVVNIASVLGLVGGDDDFATHAYAASKGALIALTRAMAVTYAPDRIRCNVVCPGLIATPMSRRVQEDPRLRGRVAELQPLTGGFGLPVDVAGAVRYLAGPESGFVTGVVLPVDGGWTAR